EAKRWFVGQVLTPYRVYDRLATLWETSPTLFARVIESVDSGVAGRTLEGLRMFQALLSGDVEGFYDPNTLSLRIKQEFGGAGVAEIGASKEKLLEIARELESLGKFPRLLEAIVLCIFAFSRIPLQGEWREEIRLLGEEFDPYVDQDLRELALRIYDISYRILGYAKGSHHLRSVISKQEEGPGLFSASAILAFLISQAFELPMISHDFLNSYIYPFLTLRGPYPSDLEKKDPALERLFRLKGLFYVRPQDVEMHLDGTPVRYLLVKNGLSDVGIGTFEKELYEATRVYNAIKNLPHQLKEKVSLFLNSENTILGIKTLFNYSTYENQMKFLSLLSVYAEKNLALEFDVDLIDLNENIDILYEKLNSELQRLNINDIIEGRLPKILLANVDYNLKSIHISFYPDIELSKMFDKINTINDFESLRSYYFEVLKKASEYYTLTERIEKKLNAIYTKQFNHLVSLQLERLAKEMSYISDFFALEKYKNSAVEKGWEMSFSKEAISKVEQLFERRKAELRQKKLNEIKEVLKGILHRNELLAYWEEVKTYLKKNKLSLGKDYMVLVARLFDDTLSKI
ncbi:MAG: hypothetical protein ACK4WB_01480, partial [Desulfatiglandales bacterium]